MVDPGGVDWNMLPGELRVGPIEGVEFGVEWSPESVSGGPSQSEVDKSNRGQRKSVSWCVGVFMNSGIERFVSNHSDIPNDSNL